MISASRAVLHAAACARRRRREGRAAALLRSLLRAPAAFEPPRDPEAHPHLALDRATRFDVEVEFERLDAAVAEWVEAASGNFGNLRFGRRPAALRPGASP